MRGLSVSEFGAKGYGSGGWIWGEAEKDDLKRGGIRGNAARTQTFSLILNPKPLNPKPKST